ncbi:hypothetical protein PZ938_12130 [Luteipulveratus sp. YIM 133132]|uniref:Phytanoyl-CoA dioxygenase n=1 Tax=Luteipulveratus flavus TaxID=3031728 RepID=A0ABT6C971_9MICO|nr:MULTISPECIES: hypothetical protein [unclassified Luteipulveratus]MDE9366350.1 hypothetical protein [Luteipulveratus sp. YIM 133132]MDF8265440.1 hypothetical protein [Luteipulveratus sp. YIM 133296]
MTNTMTEAFERELADLDVEDFWDKGYAILHDVYSPEEVERMREGVTEQCRIGGELMTGPLRHVLTDGRMAQVAQKLLGSDTVIYGGDSSATINGKIRAWHKDNTDREDAEAPDWDDQYTQLRFGVYLQDHTEHSGGLNLKVGSHVFCDLTSGETIYVKNNPGDLLVWSMRMTHSGAGTLLKDPGARFPEPNEWNAFPADQVAPEHEERMAIFAHLGADDKHGRRYLDYLKTRTYMVNAWRRRPFTPEHVAELDAIGVTVRDMPAEVKDDKRAGLNAQWQPYWYPGSASVTAAAKPAPTAPAPQAAAAPPAPRPQQAQPPFARRYGRAVQRRLKGVTRGAVRGWHDAAPKGSRR